MSTENHVASDIEPQGNDEPSLGVILFLNVLALIALWFTLFINDQFVTIFKKSFFWPPSMLETGGVALILLAVVHLIWRYFGRRLVELVKEAKAPAISAISELLLGIVGFLHPRALDSRALWASFGVALIINLVLVWRLPPACPPAGAGGTIAPAIALYSVTFVVNGVDQIVDDSDNSLQVSKNNQVTVKEVTICVAPFEGSGGTFYVEFQPYNIEDQLIDDRVVLPHQDTASGFISIPGLDYTWAIGDDWQKISVLSIHFPPGGTQNPDCAKGTCEVDDRLVVEVHPAFIATATPTATSTPTLAVPPDIPLSGVTPTPTATPRATSAMAPPTMTPTATETAAAPTATPTMALPTAEPPAAVQDYGLPLAEPISVVWDGTDYWAVFGGELWSLVKLELVAPENRFRIAETLKLPEEGYLNSYIVNLVWIDGRFWILCRGCDEHPQLDRSGKVIGTFRLPYAVKAMAWDGQYFWASTGSVLKKLELVEGSNELKEVDSFAVSAGGLRADVLGLTWDERNLWQVSSDVMSKLDSLAQPICSFSLSAAADTHWWSSWGGMTWDGHFLWVVNGDANKLYRVDPNACR